MFIHIDSYKIVCIVCVVVARQIIVSFCLANQISFHFQVAHLSQLKANMEFNIHYYVFMHV